MSEVRKRQGIFHGWFIVGVAFLAAFIHSEAVSSTLSVFVKPMTESLGWSRGQISGVRTFEQALEGLGSPIIGPIVDKHGGRVLMVVGALVAGAAFIALGFIHNLPEFYAFRGLATVGMLGIGGIVTHVAIAKWFVRMRGRALAIAGIGQFMGTIVVIPTATWLIVQFGWELTWVVFGVFVWIVVVAPAFLFMRRQPEDMGLRPDGDLLERVPERVENPRIARDSAGQVSEEIVVSQQRFQEEVFWTRSEAIRTRAFWILIVVFGFARLAQMGINLHLIPYMEDLGYSPQIAGSVFVVRALAGFVANPLWGFACERYDIRLLNFIHYLCLVLAVAIITFSQNLWMIYGGIVVYGIASGGAGILAEITFAIYYGRRHLGSIRGLALPPQLIFSAGGPLFLGYSFDLTRSYTFAFATIMGAAILCAALVLLAIKPVKRSQA